MKSSLSPSTQIALGVVVIATVFGAVASPGSSVTRSSFRQVPVPLLKSAPFEVLGSYPSIGVAADDDELRSLILNAESTFANQLQHDSNHPRISPVPTPQFRVMGRTDDLSVSPRLFSDLIPTFSQPIGGGGEGGWVSIIAQVPSGRLMSLPSLFSNASRGLNAVAYEAKRDIVRANPCVAGSLTSTTGSLWNRGFAPAPGNYRYAALTSTGLAIGFLPGQVAGDACGAPEVKIPYAALSSYWNAEGRRLINEALKVPVRRDSHSRAAATTSTNRT